MDNIKLIERSQLDYTINYPNIFAETEVYIDNKLSYLVGSVGDDTSMDDHEFGTIILDLNKKNSKNEYEYTFLHYYPAHIDIEIYQSYIINNLWERHGYIKG